MSKREREFQFLQSSHAIPPSEHLLLLCKMLEAVSEKDEEENEVKLHTA